ncbi:glycosyl hydrolase [Argonema galeatum]|uniref:glycosyl hydrolase n=1 Tax=Argonema galeatum TaxID=2942762 RepID=UPI0020118189|nr:glycosyl hydrolase [Argonema galeatum]MCL1467699.1 beta-galactosidase [Argonema galeatum A003/A1]
MRPKRWLILFLFFSLGILVARGGISVGQRANLDPPSDLIPASFFGIHIHDDPATIPWSNVPFATWRLWDAYVAWPNLEPQKGEWRFERLDKYLALAQKNKVEILLPLSLSPTWASARPQERSPYFPGAAAEPKQIEDWRNYVRTVATRYKGKIRYYQLWNEPNYKTFYTGTVEQMVTLSREAYQILKQVDPSITVVSPSATTYQDEDTSWVEEYFAKGGGNYADAIAYHFYVKKGQKPEKIIPLITTVKEIMAKYGLSHKPLWNTEAGWDRKMLSSDREQAAYLVRAYILNWTAGVSRFYYYGLHMTPPNLRTLTPAAIAYANVQKWLIGNRMTSCTENQNTWTCHLTRDGGYSAWIVWNPEHQLRFQIPDTWRVKQIQDLTGTKRKLPADRTVEIALEPLLFEK